MNHLNRLLTLTLLTAAVLATPALARDHDDDDDDDERAPASGKARGGSRQPPSRTTKDWATYQAECGSCHLAFAPSMLPARSWKALLGGLGDHFGQNAELDAPTAKALEAWLTANAGADVAGTPLRITELGWWRREHDEVSAAVYKRKAVTSPANCVACHPGANQGAFGEHDVKIPR
jgi:hypothetical protein